MCPLPCLVTRESSPSTLTNSKEVSNSVLICSFKLLTLRVEAIKLLFTGNHQGRNIHREAFRIEHLKARFFKLARHFTHGQKTFDRVRQIAIRFIVIRDQTADTGKDVVHVPIAYFTQQGRVFIFHKFQNDDKSPRFKDTRSEEHTS